MRRVSAWHRRVLRQGRSPYHDIDLNFLSPSSGHLPYNSPLLCNLSGNYCSAGFPGIQILHDEADADGRIADLREFGSGHAAGGPAKKPVPRPRPPDRPAMRAQAAQTELNSLNAEAQDNGEKVQLRERIDW